MEKIVPVTEPKKSKNTIYKIKDNLMDFWYKFIYPNRSYIEDNNYKKFREFLYEKSEGIIFAECEWQDLSYRGAEKLIAELKEKSKRIEWNNSKRREYFAVFARKIDCKEIFRKNGFLAWDLDDY